jgi:hypothetical protein
VHLRRGETYLVETLDLDRNLARVRRMNLDYYTQAIGGTDVHHIDHRLRGKPFGAGRVFWGEVTAHCRTRAFERIHFYTLDQVSVHGLDLPVMTLDTQAFWIVPPEALMEEVRRAGLDAHSGLRGIGYATRMLLPLFVTCDTADFSHTVGSVNSPWNALFVFERYPLGLGFTLAAYERMHELLPAVLDAIERCPCQAGCPCCVGKPLRRDSTANVELGEGAIPGKAAAAMILRGLLGDGSGLRQPDDDALKEGGGDRGERLRRALRRRVDRQAEPSIFHPILPPPLVRTEYPAAEPSTEATRADPAKRAERARRTERDLQRDLARHIAPKGLDPLTPRPPLPPGMRTGHGSLPPTTFPGRPPAAPAGDGSAQVVSGDPVAAEALRRRRRKSAPGAGSPPSG